MDFQQWNSCENSAFPIILGITYCRVDSNTHLLFLPLIPIQYIVVQPTNKSLRCSIQSYHNLNTFSRDLSSLSY
jgi:hypothetical protein